MRVLGIDPGSLNTGYGVIEGNGTNLKLIASGCISNKSKDNPSERYNKIYTELKKVIQKTNPEIAALENVIYCNNTRIAIKLGEARGIAILAASEMCVPIAEYAPKKVKQAVVGSGAASKIQVQHMVQHLLGLNKLPQPDTADALAVAICHINHDNILKRLANRS